MKRSSLTKILASATMAFAYGLMVLGTVSCEDMMDLDSPRVAYEDQHLLDNANDSIYSVMGIVAQLQQVADRVVLMGELRGELTTVDPQYASTDLQDINNLQLTAANQYAGARDFYAIINNCNYIIARMDTTITEGQTKVMVPEYAQVKTLRAWTYWQLGLIFGKVNYYTQPLINANTAINGQTLDLDALAGTLIADLLPIAEERPLDYGSVDGWSSSQFFLPTKMLLGDLYLYSNQYEQAAQAYYDLIVARRLTVSSGYANTWQAPTRLELNNGNQTAYRNEVITRLVFDSELRSEHSQLRKLTYSDTPCLLPVAAFTEWMQKRIHFHTDNGQGISRYFAGDLRGCAELSTGRQLAQAFGPADAAQLPNASTQQLLITKYFNNLNGSTTDLLSQRPLTSLALVRPTTVYLRYAEAINRAGFPSTAFAVLKYGLTNTNINDTLRVDSNEVKRLPAWINFSASTFSSNVGTAARGCGMGISFDREQYVIPADVDSIDYVERAILDEMAAETCFEGNRFFDLLCVSRHRQGHPAFMAEQVAAKLDDPQTALTRLKELSTWFVKE